MKRCLVTGGDGWAIAPILRKLRSIVIILVALLLLTGCVRYDVTINISGQNHGEIVQHIRLEEQLTSFSDAAASDWLKSIEQRTRQLGGRTKRLSSREMIAKIPFNNGAELETKFNEFFNPTDPAASPYPKIAHLELPNLKSQIQIKQKNLFLVERNHLMFDLDLRSLGVVSPTGNLLISPGSLLDLEFNLMTPWGARRVDAGDSLEPEVREDGKQLVWVLKPGKFNHLDVVFWVPSPLGIGSVAIAIFVAAGTVIKSLLSEPLDQMY